MRNSMHEQVSENARGKQRRKAGGPGNETARLHSTQPQLAGLGNQSCLQMTGLSSGNGVIQRELNVMDTPNPDWTGVLVQAEGGMTSDMVFKSPSVRQASTMLIWYQLQRRAADAEANASTPEEKEEIIEIKNKLETEKNAQGRTFRDFCMENYEQVKAQRGKSFKESFEEFYDSLLIYQIPVEREKRPSPGRRPGPAAVRSGWEHPGMNVSQRGRGRPVPRSKVAVIRDAARKMMESGGPPLGLSYGITREQLYSDVAQVWMSYSPNDPSDHPPDALAPVPADDPLSHLADELPPVLADAASITTGEQMSANIDKMNSSGDLYQFRTLPQLINCLRVLLFDDRVEVKFLNVGQGSAALITTKAHREEKHRVINDLGPNDVNILRTLYRKKNANFSHLFLAPLVVQYLNIGEKPEDPVLKEQLQAALNDVWRGVSRHAYLLITHAHDDHMAGMEAKELRTLFGSRLIAIGQNDYDAHNRDAAGSQLTIRGHVPQSKSDSINSDSLISYKISGDTVYLFPGDRPIEDINTMLIPQLNGSIPPFSGRHVVIAASHHGSSTGIDDELVKKLMAAHALNVTFVVSAGIDNTYGHPTAEFMHGTRDQGAEVYNTMDMNDEQGSIVAKSAQASGLAPALYYKFKEGLQKISKTATRSSRLMAYRKLHPKQLPWGQSQNVRTFTDMFLVYLFHMGAPDGDTFQAEDVAAKVSEYIDQCLKYFLLSAPELKDPVKDNLITSVFNFYAYCYRENISKKIIDEIADEAKDQLFNEIKDSFQFITPQHPERVRRPVIRMDYGMKPPKPESQDSEDDFLA